MALSANRDRAEESRHLDVVRSWQRHSRAQTVDFTDPSLEPDASVVQQMRSAGLEVSVHADVFQTLLAVGSRRTDAVVLSAAVPSEEAARAVASLRDESGTEVLLALASGEVDDAGPTILAGARPLLTRPYRFTELLRALATIDVGTCVTAAVEIGCLIVDPSAAEARVRGRYLPMSPRELILLHALARRADHVVASDDLSAALWPGRPACAHNLPQVVARLRRRLEAAGLEGAVVNTRGLGYRLTSRSLK